MVEPTETESQQTLDKFADALLKIAEEAHSTSPELLTSALRTTHRSGVWTKSKPPKNWS